MKTSAKDDPVRADIVRAAETVFRRWGLSKTTMEDIAREAGKGKSTLYYYFQSKDDILEAMAQYELDRIIGLAREMIAGKKTAKEQLLAYVLTIFQEIRELMTPLNFERDLASVRAVIDRVGDKFIVLNEKVVEPILRSGLERGEFRSIQMEDLKITTQAIGGVIKSLAFNLFFDSRDKSLIDPIIRLMSEGL
ncbi:MAG: TetR/AcrR family transcriptional regulator [Acidobacteriota bacterium]